MIVYLDTGIMLDYLSQRSHGGALLRTANRRGRTPNQLCDDATTCFDQLRQHHETHTSSLTLFEAEKTLFDAMSSQLAAVPDRFRYIVTSARAISVQVLTAVRFNRIIVDNLDVATFEHVVGDLELQQRGIRVGDSLHMVSAIRCNAELLISGDAGVIGLDGVFRNNAGQVIRCLDTDTAMTVL